MERARLAAAALAVLASLALSQGPTLEEYRLSIDLSEGGEAHCTISLTYVLGNESLSGGSLALPGRASYVSVRDDEGALKFSQGTSANATQVRFLFRSNLPAGGRYKVGVEFWTFDLTRKEREWWVLELAYAEPPRGEGHLLEVTLPEGATYAPVEAAWERIRAEGGRLVLSSSLEPRDVALEYTLPSEQGLSAAALLAAGAALLAGVLAVRRALRPRPAPPPARPQEEPPALARLLDGSERRLYQLVLDAKTGVRQSELVERTALPKSTVSRTLDRLERKGLVKKERSGREFVISLR